MVNVYVSLAAVTAIILFIFIVNLIGYKDQILSKNKRMGIYKSKNDPYIKELTSNFELRYDLKWYEARGYLKKIEQIIENVQDYEMSNRSKH